MLRAQRIVATGEDTTIALAALVAAQANLPLAVVPQGGVYGNQAGLSYDVSEAIHLAAAGRATRSVQAGLAGILPFVWNATMAAKGALRKKPFLSRIWIDGEEVHDGGTLVLQLTPPPPGDPAAGLNVRLVPEGGKSQAIERRCEEVEASLPLDGDIEVDGKKVVVHKISGGAALRFRKAPPFSLVVPG